jgi:hypothetical protein
MMVRDPALKAGDPFGRYVPANAIAKLKRLPMANFEVRQLCR